MKKIMTAFLILAIFQFGASESSEKGSAMSMTPAGWGDQIAKMFAKKKSSKSSSDRRSPGGPTASNQNPAVLGGGAGGGGAGVSPLVSTKYTLAQPVASQSIFKKTQLAVPIVSPRIPIVRPPAITVPQIRKEIQKIMVLNTRIRGVQSGNASQFQRIEEQAKIHEKILSELEKTSEEQTTEKKSSGKEELLAQEKLRIIHEETQKSGRLLEQNMTEEVPKDNPPPEQNELIDPDTEPAHSFQAQKRV